jgi:hypothetical protein
MDIIIIIAIIIVCCVVFYCVGRQDERNCWTGAAKDSAFNNLVIHDDNKVVIYKVVEVGRHIKNSGYSPINTEESGNPPREE